MKRCAVFVAVFVTLLAAVHGQAIKGFDKTRYKEISLKDYMAAGNVKERTDTELFKMNFKFLLQAANSVAVKDAEDALHRFASEKKLDFERDDELVLYVRSTHSEEGYWETEIIDLAEPKPAPAP
ncbi:MAG: hypothetical protein LBG14_05650 [Treponema sp.]|jgi:hypothetical protein|nr:hypothetical protein [Treponema sp.]